MSAPDAPAPRICPVCGYANSNLSLFCAECGSVLNVDTSETPTSHAATSPSDSDTQQTLAFSPASGADDYRRAVAPPVSTANPTSDATGRWQAPAPAGSEQTAFMPSAGAGAAGTPEFANAALPPYSDDDESLRGFFLGVLAIVLILIVAAIYTWTILPNGSLRDSIQSWIDALP
ncbi:MAG: hypothetical protein WBA63_12725 [Thermomicrobiales bacterium]